MATKIEQLAPELEKIISTSEPIRSLADGARDPNYDGITEIHWADFDAAVRSMGSREMTVEQAADAAQFAAPRSVELVLVSEYELT